jgi:2,4-dienoyl-CoA reductase-like NADH-dependent reductase (Old Yellow Enzyme family)
MAIDSDGLIPGFSSLTERVHAHGSKLAMQLSPVFRYGGDMVAPSPIIFKWAPDITPRALTIEEIGEIVKVYGDAGERAYRAGLDAVQIHGAHGYPICSFLSPLFNQRDDKYGGSAENRARIVIEIAAEIRKRTEENFPVFIKMNVADFCQGGMTIDDAVDVAKVMTQNGIAAIETSGGANGHEVTPLGPVESSKWREGYFMEYASAIKEEVDVPVILVGGLRDFNMMEEVIDQGKADLISMSRPFIREPHIVKRWMEGNREPSDCTSCNGCMDLYSEGEAIECIVE